MQSEFISTPSATRSTHLLEAVIRSRNHMQSHAIIGNQRTCLRQSFAPAITCNHMQSHAIIGNQRTCLRQSFAPAASPLAIALSFAESSDEASFIGPSLA